MNGANTSSISAPLSASSALSSWSTPELTTIGRKSAALAGGADLVGRRQRLVAGVDEGNAQSVLKSVPVNWVSRLWPMVSAVMPVPSEM